MECYFNFSLILINLAIRNQQIFYKMMITMNISIKATSDYAQNKLGNTPIARIHSVYNKTINLLINNQIFALQPQDGYLSPVSLITYLTLEQFQQLHLLPAQSYQLHLNYQESAIFCSKLTACSSTTITQADFYQETAKQILLQSDAKGLNLLLKSSSDDLILSAIQQYLGEFTSFYDSEDIENAAQVLAKIIGLGIGLTPSGDDFLCGFLSVLQYFNRTETLFYQQLIQEIQQNLDRTNPISCRFIECALEQQYSVAILSFFKATTEEKMEIKRLAQLFENIGHSSGMDTLFGIYFACGLILKKSRNN